MTAMPATRPTDRISAATLLPGLAVSLGLLALTACSPAATDPTPRLLTTQELRAGFEDARAARPTTPGDVESRAAGLRSRAAALRRQPAAPADETDDLRRRAQTLTTSAP